MKISTMLYNKDIPHTEKKNILRSATKSKQNYDSYIFCINIFCLYLYVMYFKVMSNDCTLAWIDGSSIRSSWNKHDILQYPLQDSICSIVLSEEPQDAQYKNNHNVKCDRSRCENL